MNLDTRASGVTHLLAPARFGGLETVVATLSRAQADAGLSVQVVSVLGPGADDHPFPRTIDARVRSTVLKIPPRAYLEERRGVLGALTDAGSTLLHTHGYRPDVIDSGAARRRGLATVTTVHGFTGGGWKNRLYERLQVRAFRRMDAVVAVSERLRERLAEAGVPDRLLHAVPNAWAASGSVLARADARRRLGLPADGPVLGWVGRLTREKGPDVAVRALAALPNPTVRLAMVGDGPMRDELRALATEVGVADRIDWHGAVDGAGDLLGAFDALVLSSWTEGTPMALLEAMSSGVPIVATAVGGVPDLVGKDGGLLVAPGDPAALADAVRDALADPTATRARTAAARARLDEQFAIGPWVERYSKIYDSILRTR